MTIKLTTDKAVVVHTGQKWIPVAREKPPQGAKLQLIHRKYGVAAYGFWTHWHPLPTFDDAEEQ